MGPPFCQNLHCTHGLTGQLGLRVKSALHPMWWMRMPPDAAGSGDGSTPIAAHCATEPVPVALGGQLTSSGMTGPADWRDSRYRYVATACSQVGVKSTRISAGSGKSRTGFSS